ncbi:hypothetical protein HYX10_01205 [Candidatus Woesearchaeota archaeon]|nr:hypothetical protein [Candidatus Woesearchaeota archaeon]
MATIFDLSLLREFSLVFVWVLIFVLVYGILEVTNIFKNRGLHALIAIAITILLGTTSGVTTVVTGLIPWFVITGFFVVFFLVLSNFIGVPTKEVLQRFGGEGAVWWLFVPLTVGLMIALVAGGQFARSQAPIDSETGEPVTTPGKVVLDIITDPKVLALMIILGISAVTVVLMAGTHKITS